MDFYKELLQQTPTNLLVYKAEFPEFTVMEGSNVHFKALGLRREDVVGKSLVEAFPQNTTSWTFESIENLIRSFQKVIATKAPDRMPVVRYDIPKENGIEVTYWSSDNYPIFDDKGEVAFIMNKSLDVSRLMM